MPSIKALSLSLRLLAAFILFSTDVQHTVKLTKIVTMKAMDWLNPSTPLSVL